MLFCKKCSRKYRSTKAECSICQVFFAWYIKYWLGQRTWIAVKRHLLLYRQSSVSSC